MKRLIFKLLLLADRFPDGFTIVLPDGSMIQIQWLFGSEIEERPDGITIRQAFGMSLKGSDFDEVIITLYVAG
ncbi:hypothetical protein FAM09_24785 [Niastella caeni]|uniref:Uncharacterized protein n=1 Tax=Niastella caeni TaxID=2569763 RepID=A0A4S8HGE7_9BACT|nr:hypothetical protein [Niastella caeni]THU34238.1 hypothetical protein FAM09_24785 [Niastella caeni]